MNKHAIRLNVIREEIRHSKGIFELREARVSLSAFVLLHPEMSDAKHELDVLDSLINLETGRGV